MSLQTINFLNLFEVNNPEEIFDIYLDQMTMRDMQKIYLVNPRFKKIFLNRFNEVIKKQDSFFYFDIAFLFKDSEGKDAIIANLPNVLEKMMYRDMFFSEWMPDKKLLNDNIDALFVKVNIKEENNAEKDVDYSNIFGLLFDYYNCDEILEIISNHMDNIILDGKYFSDIMVNINEYINDCKLPKESLEEVIKKIDEALVRNLDKILEKNALDDFFISPFDKMEVFLNEIKKRGIEFFYKFHLREEVSMEERKNLCLKLFDKYDEKSFAIMQFGEMGEQLTKVIEIVTKELISKSNGDFTVDDIKLVGEGGFSKVFLIGNYILKLGSMRENREIPNDKRILQPIIRQYINSDLLDNYNYNFLEIQNEVETEWWQGMTQQEIEEVLYEVFADIRSRGIIWCDIKKENIGKLIKPNKSNYTFVDIDAKEKDLRPTQEATGLIGELSEEDILPPGEYVVIDTDFIDTQKTYADNSETYIKFEIRYMNSLEPNNKSDDGR